MINDIILHQIKLIKTQLVNTGVSFEEYMLFVSIGYFNSVPESLKTIISLLEGKSKEEVKSEVVEAAKTINDLQKKFEEELNKRANKRGK